MLRKLLGIKPKKTSDGAFSPSPVALKLGTSKKSNYEETEYNGLASSSDINILIVCTEKSQLAMRNGKNFSTGNHPLEMLVPILHFKKAGFNIVICTPTGDSVKIEKWALPSEDDKVMNLFDELEGELNKPKSLEEIVQSGETELEKYNAIFIPGGHGALIGLPEDKNLKELLRWAMKYEVFILSICHGPAAFLSAGMDELDAVFPFRGYKMAVFPDSVDAQSPLIGYMPGHLTWKFGEKLKKLGVRIINKKADDTCCKDRNLITGASPDAANKFGEMATKAILESIDN